MVRKLRDWAGRTLTLGLRGGVYIGSGGGRVTVFRAERRCNTGARR